MADRDTGRYRSWVGEKRWRHGDGVATTIATQDAPAEGTATRAVRILRVRPATPPPDAATSAGGQVYGEHIDLLEINVEVRRNEPRWDAGDEPADHGQGESVLLDRDQAVAVRRALDAFITDAVVLLPDEAAAAAIVKEITATGDPFGRPRSNESMNH